MKASSLSFRAAVLLVLAGMAWGIQMAATDDHTAYPAHAHLNLLGWVSLFLFGIFYHLHPRLDQRGIAIAQVWGWIVGTIVMAIGIALAEKGNAAGDPLAGIGSFIVLGAMLTFGWLVFRRDRYATTLRTAAAPVA